MKEIIGQILPLWGIEDKQLLQVYPSAWEINGSYIVKVYNDKKQLERNIKISEILLHCKIPVAKIILTKKEEKYVEYKNIYFFLSENYKEVIFLIGKIRQLLGKWARRLHSYIKRL